MEVRKKKRLTQENKSLYHPLFEKEVIKGLVCRQKNKTSTMKKSIAF